MIANNLGVVEMLLSGALVLAFCLYQYVSVGRSIDRDKGASADSTARHAEGEHRLDDG